MDDLERTQRNLKAAQLEYDEAHQNYQQLFPQWQAYIATLDQLAHQEGMPREALEAGRDALEQKLTVIRERWGKAAGHLGEVRKDAGPDPREEEHP
jgi:hypothetical protein